MVDCLLWTVQAALTGGSVLTRGYGGKGTSVSSRRAILQGTAAFAGLAAVQASGLVNELRRTIGRTVTMWTKPVTASGSIRPLDERRRELT